METLAYPLLRDAAEHARLSQQAQFWSAEAAALFETAGVAAGSRVADLGCGTLHVATLLGRFVGREGSVLALDSDAALVEASRRGGGHGVVVETGDAYAAPLQGGSLNAVHARFLAAPAGRLDSLIGEMRRLVPPGGLLMLQEPIADSWDVPVARDEWQRTRALIRAGFLQRGGDFDIGRQLAPRLEAAGVSEVRTRMVVHRLTPRIPMRGCRSRSAIRWRHCGARPGWWTTSNSMHCVPHSRTAWAHRAPRSRPSPWRRLGAGVEPMSTGKSWRTRP